jgi:hypothetical protein
MCGLVMYSLTLRFPQRKQSYAESLGERGGHGSYPHSEITCSGYISRTTSMHRLLLTILLELYGPELGSTGTQFWCEEATPTARATFSSKEELGRTRSRRKVVLKRILEK